MPSLLDLMMGRVVKPDTFREDLRDAQPYTNMGDGKPLGKIDLRQNVSDAVNKRPLRLILEDGRMVPAGSPGQTQYPVPAAQNPVLMATKKPSAEMVMNYASQYPFLSREMLINPNALMQFANMRGKNESTQISGRPYTYDMEAAMKALRDLYGINDFAPTGYQGLESRKVNPGSY